MNGSIPRVFSVVVLVWAVLSTWTDHARAAEEPEIVPGRNIITTCRTPIKVEDRVLLTLRKGTVLRAGRLEGDWISVTVRQGEKKIKGWAYAKHIAPKKPDLNDAVLFLVVGQLDRAIAECDELQRREPEQLQVCFFRGLCYRVYGDFDKAVADCDKLLEAAAKEIDLKRDDLIDKLDKNARGFLASVYNLRGAARMRKGDLAPALADFEEAIRVDPKYQIARWNRFLVLLMQGNSEKAEADKKQGLRCPDKKTLQDVLGLFENLAHTRPELVEPHVICGFCYWTQGKPEKAIDAYTKAIRLDPNQAAVYFRRGLAYCAKGENQKAETDLDKARQLAPHLAKAVLSTPDEPAGDGRK